MTVVNGIDAILFTSSGSHEQNFMTQRSLAMRESIVRLECKRALKQRQSLQRRFRMFGRHNGEKLSLVCDVQGIEAQKLASAAYRVVDRNVFLEKNDSQSAVASQFV